MAKETGLFLLAGLILAGCATADVEQLQTRVNSLDRQLSQCRDDTAQVQAAKQEVARNLAEEQRQKGIVLTEKKQREAEASSLRSDVRAFVKEQLAVYRNLIQKSSLTDPVGSEPVQRAFNEGEKLLLVDVRNPAPADGMIHGVGGYFVTKTNLSLKVLRPLVDKYFVVWESQPIPVTASGNFFHDFEVPISVQKGDLFAYYFPGPVNVPFDKGAPSGGMLFDKSENVRIGEGISMRSLSGEAEKRVYSLAVYGIFN